jgi:hypothetical protein
MQISRISSGRFLTFTFTFEQLIKLIKINYRAIVQRRKWQDKYFSMVFRLSIPRSQWLGEQQSLSTDQTLDISTTRYDIPKSDLRKDL